ncbi:MAG TPA: cytochrome P450 [Herpetosiphonaceae bacterium]
MTALSTEDTLVAPASQPRACPYHHVGADFDPLSPAHLADPYRFYAHARQEDPIFWSPFLQSWIITRYDDLLAILRDPQRFSSAGMIEGVVRYTPEVQAVLRTGMPFLVNSLANIDPPQHTRIRASVGKAFAARRINTFEPRIRQAVDRLIDQFIDHGHADLVEEFNYPFPALVIFDLIGVPEADLAQVRGWSSDVVELLFSPLSPERQLACAHSAIAYQRYVTALIEQRRAAPRDDLTSDLIRAIDAGEAHLSLEELVELLFDLVLAGHETTANLLGTCMAQLLGDSNVWRDIQAHPERIPNVVEEAVRFNGPALGFFRKTTESVVMSGVTLPEGARVFVLFSAANHDPAAFADPDTFQPQREAGRHLGFGQGIHFCLGAPLARLEMRIALETLSSRLPSLRLAPDQTLRYRPSLTIRGLERLLVVWDTD